MQPDPHSSPRNSEAWGSDDDKPKKRAKAKKKPAKKTTSKASTKKSASKSMSADTTATKKPRKDPALPESVTAFVERLLTDRSAARQLAAIMATGPQRPKADDSRALRALQRELADSRRKLADLEQKLTELSNLVADLTAARFAPVVSAGEDVEEDPCLRWLGDPSIEPYIGQYVALHATRGVIAHGDSLPPVLESVRAQGVSLDDVCLATVPALPF